MYIASANPRFPPLWFCAPRLGYRFDHITAVCHVKAFTATPETLRIVIHYIWQFGLPLLRLSPARALVYLTVSQGLGSILLALVFVLNHNGRAVLNRDTTQTKYLYEIQILTSRNIQSTYFLDWSTGGLNYQIEHHLFATLPRHNYHLVAPVRRNGLCQVSDPLSKDQLWARYY